MNSVRVAESSQGRLIALLGPSGVGKSTLLRYLKTHHGAESAPKYTTRKSRGTDEDRDDFIFCNTEQMPSGSDVLVFESYGNTFGIQLSKIDNSLNNGKDHVIVIGDVLTATKLKQVYGKAMMVILVYCESKELERRVKEGLERRDRWQAIVQEMAQIYPLIGVSQHIVNNTYDLESTFLQMDLLVQILGKSYEGQP